MAVRTDIFTIDWDVSPRIIWVDISETEVIAQDLYDTCRYYEAQTANMDDDPIIDAAGGEPLGGSVSVGLTVSLLNAQYAFAARPGPDWVVCNMTGGNVVAFTDATRTVELYPRYPTAYVSADRTASSSATAIGIDSVASEVWTEVLEGGYTAADIMQFIAAVLAGKVSGVGTDTEVFIGVDDSTPRITTTLDEDGNRITVTRNV